MKTLHTILFLAIFFHCNAQMPDYYIFLVKGDVSVSKPGGKPVLLKQNVFIYKDQVIILKKDAELTLSDRDQNFFVLRSPGINKAKDLNKTKSAHIQGVTQK